MPYLITLIAFVFKNKQKIENNKDFYSNLLLLHVFNDKISNTNLKTKELKIIIETKKYLSVLSNTDFNQNINNYFLKNSKQTGKFDKITSVSMLILNILNNESENMQYSNIISKKSINDLNKKNDYYLPINCIANLTIHEKIESKRKPLKTY